MPGQLIVVVEVDELEGTEPKKGNPGKMVGYATFVRSGGTKMELAKWNADCASKSMFAINAPPLHE
jgi:hypothetical protein